MQFLILKEQIRKNILFILAFFLFLIVDIIILKVGKPIIELNDVIALMNIPKSDLGLLMMYKFILIILFTYRYHTYELDHIYDFIFLRVHPKKFLKSKLFHLSLAVVLFDILHYILILIPFYDIIGANLDYFIYPVLFDLLLTTVVLVFITIFKNKTSIIVASIIYVLLMYEVFSITVFLILILISLLVVSKTYKFKI